MTAALSLAELQALRREIDAALNALYREYVDAYNTAFERQVVESVPARGSHAPRMDADTLVSEAKAVLRDHGKLRGQLKSTSAFVRRTHEGLINHRHWLLAAFEADERRHGAEFNEVTSPEVADIDDVRAAAEAQRQRLERGESLTGDDAETRDRTGERPLDDVLNSAKKGNLR